MGAQASTNISTINTDLTTQAYNQCPRVTVSNTVDMSKVNFLPNSTCKNPSFAIDQTAGVDANCLITNLQQSLASSIAGMDATTQGGFGFQASTNAANIQSQITQQTENSCGTLSSTNAANLQDVTVTACDFHIVQNATAKSACTLNSLQKLANTVSVQQSATAQGLTLASLLFGYGGIGSIIMGIVVLIIIAGLGYYLFGGESDEDKPKFMGPRGFSPPMYRPPMYQPQPQPIIIQSPPQPQPAYYSPPPYQPQPAYQPPTPVSQSYFGLPPNPYSAQSNEASITTNQEGGWNFFGNVADDSSILGAVGKRKYSLLIIGLLIIVSIFVTRTKKSNVTFKKSDFDNLKSKINEAQQMAGVNEPIVRSPMVSPSVSPLNSPLNSPCAPRSELFQADYTYNLYEGDGNLDDFYKPLLCDTN